MKGTLSRWPSFSQQACKVKNQIFGQFWAMDIFVLSNILSFIVIKDNLNIIWNPNGLISVVGQYVHALKQTILESQREMIFNQQYTSYCQCKLI